MLDDGREFQNSPTPDPTYFVTMSWLQTVTLPGTLRRGQSVTVSGRTLRPGTNYPLRPTRKEGYLIRTTAGITFTAW